VDHLQEQEIFSNVGNFCHVLLCSWNFLYVQANRPGKSGAMAICYDSTTVLVNIGANTGGFNNIFYYPQYSMTEGGLL